MVGSSPTQVTIASISLSHGEWRKIEGSADFAQDTGAALERDGFSRYSVANQNVCELASSSMIATIKLGGLEPSTIPYVIIATQSFWDLDSNYDNQHITNPTMRFRSNLYHAADRAGFRNSNLIANWTAGCANLGQAIEIAYALVLSGCCEDVVVSAADRLDPACARVEGMGLVSDASASLLVTSRSVPGVVVRDVVTHTDLSLIAYKDRARYLVAYNRASVTAARVYKEKTGTDLQSSRILTANYRRSYLEVMAQSMGFEPGNLCTSLRASIGYARSIAPVLTLDKLSKDDPLFRGSSVLLFAGPVSWTMIRVQNQ